MEIIETLKERFITWRTGKDKTTRAWEAWRHENINYRAERIKDIFAKFKHIIEVDPEKFFDFNEPFGWVPCEDAKQYLYPIRELGNNIVWKYSRVISQTPIGLNGPENAEWWENEIGGIDKVFIATNNEQDAIMIALKYGKS